MKIIIPLKWLILLIFIFIQVSPTNVYSQSFGYQPGYVVTDHSDTLHGYVHSQSQIKKYRLVQFKNLTGKKTKFLPGSIKSYNYGGENFESIKVVQRLAAYIGDYLFMRRMEKGEVNLYECTYKTNGMPVLDTEGKEISRGYSVNTDYYLEHRNGENLWVIRHAFKVKIAKFFKEYQRLSDLIIKEEYTYQDLSLIVQIYNDWCERGKPKEDKKPLPLPLDKYGMEQQKNGRNR